MNDAILRLSAYTTKPTPAPAPAPADPQNFFDFG